MGISLLVGKVGILGMTIAGIDHAFNCVIDVALLDKKL
jgi:hypothetical protein